MVFASALTINSIWYPRKGDLTAIVKLRPCETLQIILNGNPLSVTDTINFLMTWIYKPLQSKPACTKSE